MGLWLGRVELRARIALEIGLVESCLLAGCDSQGMVLDLADLARLGCRAFWLIFNLL